MYAIEFMTKIKNGSIEIPKEYQQRLREQTGDNTVRVIILASDRRPFVDLIDELLANPIPVDGFVPFTRDELHERN
jgi:hypothetical protein